MVKEVFELIKATLAHWATFRKKQIDLAFQTSHEIGALDAEWQKENTIWRPLQEGCFEINIVGEAHSKPGPPGTRVLRSKAGDAILSSSAS